MTIFKLGFASPSDFPYFSGDEPGMTKSSQIWNLSDGGSRVVTTAIHDGNALRPELLPFITLDEPNRLREEDPFTGRWASISDTCVVGTRSRFEVDLNRPRNKAVYLRPEDAWGLTVYPEGLPDDVLQSSLAEYDSFYDVMHGFFTKQAEAHGTFVVLDLHTYNHRRGGPAAPPSAIENNPEVNIGTGTMSDRRRWAPVINRFMSDLSAFDYDGRHLDVRENVKFLGGHFASWIHATFPENACVISVEFKKFFMDEWSGNPDDEQVDLIQGALESTLPGIISVLTTLEEHD